LFSLQRSILDDPESGFVVDDSLEIRYTCELLVTDGGAAATVRGTPWAAEVPEVPPSTLGSDLATLLQTGRQSVLIVLSSAAGCECLSCLLGASMNMCGNSMMISKLLGSM
jgi:hypothetical protein